MDYWFISEQEFRQDIEKGRFIEYAVVHGNLYGTPFQPVIDAMEAGRNVLLDIDVQGAEQIKDKLPSAIMVYILPPSRNVLEERLRRRGTEDEDSLRRRLRTADLEVEKTHIYDFLVVNGELSKAVADLKAIVRAESLRMPEGGVQESWHSSKRKS
ncbi:MAG: hypothetical protein Kow00107_10550 [Planctomycetota bacterium]